MSKYVSEVNLMAIESVGLRCPNCGAPDIDSRAVIGPKCGVETGFTTNSQKTDSGSVVNWIIGFLIPIVGLLLYVLWKDEKPVSAKQALNGVLISIVLSIISAIVTLIFMTF